MKKSIYIKIIILFIIDQISKILINTFIPLNAKVWVINNFLKITNVNNTGIAFGILRGQKFLILGLNVISIFVLIYYLNNVKKSKLKDISFIFLISGILGNLLDRLFLGYVRDFISFNIGNYNFPIFNISDILIFFGSIILIYLIYGEEYGNKS